MKTLRVLLLFLALHAAPHSWSSTLVSGDVDDEIWTAAGSPYFVVGDVSVGSLMIERGVVVQFEGNYVFLVPGILQVKGAAGNEVHFTTTNTAAGWRGIWFRDSSRGSFFEHTIIEYSRNSAVRITNGVATGGGVPAFTNCTIINNSSPDFGGGIDANLRSGDLILDNCLIGTNTCGIHGGGINAIVETGVLKMIHCTVVSNTANVAYAGGSYVGGGIRVEGRSVLLNCLIADNLCNGYASGGRQNRVSYGGGIYSAVGDAVFKNCRFQRNTARSSRCCGDSSSYSYGGAVYFRDGHLIMQNCIVDTNTCSSTHDSSGSGVMVGTGSGGSGTAEIINCNIIANNTHGLYGWGGAINCVNSILFFNNSGSVQVGGDVTASYSDIQGGYPGEGNKAIDPLLRAGTLELRPTSPCIDMGNPDPRYNDICLPPSRGTARNDMGAYGGPGACCWIMLCKCPVLGELANQATCAGMSVNFCATVTSTEPLGYQWRYHGTNSVGPPADIANATNACLMLSNVDSNHIGFYSVRVSSPSCAPVESNPAQLLVYAACFSLDLYPGLSITGQVGRAYCIQYTTELSDNPVWTSLTNITLTAPEYFFLDPQPARHCDNVQASPPRRFYRVVDRPCQ